MAPGMRDRQFGFRILSTKLSQCGGSLNGTTLVNILRKRHVSRFSPLLFAALWGEYVREFCQSIGNNQYFFILHDDLKKHFV